MIMVFSAGVGVGVWEAIIIIIVKVMVDTKPDKLLSSVLMVVL